MSKRQAQAWLAGEGGPSGEALIRLVLSDAGFALLAALMGEVPAGERPAWWRALKRQSEISELRRLQEEQRALLERLEREAIDG